MSKKHYMRKLRNGGVRVATKPYNDVEIVMLMDDSLRGIVDYRGSTMIANHEQLEATFKRIAWFQQQVAQLRKTEANPVNYRAATSGFLAELDRMQLEVREYFSQPAKS